jgi:hypothetical protein
VSGAAIVTAASRFEPTVVDDTLAILAPDGATAQQRTDVETFVEVQVGAGPWLSLAGGVLALGGGIMTLAWASAASSASDPELEPDGSTD